jgi:NAD(P)-dependent dehydrogenase (short-subunit alcohol dehydrogenase family)
MWTSKNIESQEGRIAIVTGANAGVGYETALALYRAGAIVILACRDRKKAEKAMRETTKQKGNGSPAVGMLDLSSARSIKDFADEFAQKHERLDLLINNAGVMIPPASKTAAGYELQFGVNFLGHFALTGYLYPLLKRTPGSRVVTLTSLAYLRGMIDFDNLQSEKSYEPMREYSQSKLACLIFALELQRRIALAGDKIRSIAAQPGANRTELSRHMDQEEFSAAVKRVGGLMEPWQGALPSLYAAISGEAKGGELYGPDCDGGYRGFPARAEIAKVALDPAVAKLLWEKAEDITGITYPIS